MNDPDTMIHNFRSEIERLHIDPDIKGFLLELYKMEESGFSQPEFKPGEKNYETVLNKQFNGNSV